MRRLPSIQIAVHAATAVVALGLLATAWWRTELDYRQTVQEVLRVGDRRAQQLAIRTAEVLDDVDRTLQFVAVLADQQRLPPLRALREGGVLANDVADDLLLTDARGFVVDSTAETPPLNVADDEAFKAHQAGQVPGLLVGQVRADPMDGRWGLTVSRSRQRGNKGFNGVVATVVAPTTLTAPFAAALSPNSAITVLGTDGAIRARLQSGRISHGGIIDVASALQSVRDTERTLEPAISPIDGERRFIRMASVERYPLLALYATDADSALAPYRAARDRTIAWTTGLLVLLLLADLGLTLQARRLDRASAERSQARARYRAMLEGSLDAVVFLSAQRDAQGEVVDFVVAKANRRAAQMIGLERAEQLLGRTLGELLPSSRGGPLTGLFVRLLERGEASEARVQATDPPLTGRWLQHQMVPIDDGLALISRDVTDEHLARAALDSLARQDPLTGLANRRQFEHGVQLARAKAQRSGALLALLFLDLDGFKKVNDELGHAAGDRILVEVARRLLGSVRGGDLVSRLGGDEFTVVMESAGRLENVRDLGERLLGTLSEPHTLPGTDGPVSRRVPPSIGIAVFDGRESAEDLCRRADEAMYAAKRAGKGRCVLATGEAQQALLGHGSDETSVAGVDGAAAEAARATGPG